MKDYLWIIVAGCFALVSFLYFMMTLPTSSSLIKKLKKSKMNILLNLTVFLIGIANVGVAIYLLQDIRSQIELFNSF